MVTEGPPDTWRNYIEKTKDNPPRPFLIEALEFVKERGAALDMGPGALNASKYLLDQGFRSVIALDAKPVAVEIAQSLPQDRFNYIISSFEQFNFPLNAYDLINAEFSLPFSTPQEFDRVFDAITHSLKEGGVLTGQLFGDRDEWANNPRMTFHTEAQARKVLGKLNILKFLPDERDGKTAEGNPKHWHIFHFIAQKTLPPSGTSLSVVR